MSERFLPKVGSIIRLSSGSEGVYGRRIEIQDGTPLVAGLGREARVVAIDASLVVVVLLSEAPR